MKRICGLLMVLCMLGVLLTGCGSREDRAARKEALNALSDNYQTTYSVEGTTIEPTKLLSQDDVELKLIGITGTVQEPSLMFAVRNGTRGTIHLSMTSLVVNGWVLGSYFENSDVSSHTVTTAEVVSYNDFSSLLAAAGAEDYIWSISMRIDIYDNEFNSIGSVSYEAATSSTTGGEEPVALDGLTVLEKDGITVKLAQTNVDDTRSELVFYLENDTGLDIDLASRKVYLNDTLVDMWLWSEVLPYTRCAVSGRVADGDTYDDIVVTAEDKLSFNLEVYNFETGEVLISKDITIPLGEVLNTNA